MLTTENIGGVWYEEILYVKFTYFLELNILILEIVKHRRYKNFSQVIFE